MRFICWAFFGVQIPLAGDNLALASHPRMGQSHILRPSTYVLTLTKCNDFSSEKPSLNSIYELSTTSFNIQYWDLHFDSETNNLHVLIVLWHFMQKSHFSQHFISKIQSAAFHLNLGLKNLKIHIASPTFSNGPFSPLLLIVFSACGGIRTGINMPVLTTYFPRAGLKWIVRGTTITRLSYRDNGLFYPSLNRLYRITDYR